VVITSTPFVPMRAIAFLALGPPRADGVAGEEHLPPGVQQSGGDRTQSGRSPSAVGSGLHPFGDLCRLFDHLAGEEAAEDGAIAAAAGKISARQRTHWIGSANLSEDPIPQTDQNEDW
jgi:hypothetical protein